MDPNNEVNEYLRNVEGQLDPATGVVLHSGSEIPIKYFFTAFYNDQTFFNQHPEDICVLLPEDQRAGKSSYSDVDHSRLVAFALSDDKTTRLVDLTTGFFHVNGIEFAFHGDADEEGLGPKTLIFNREHTHTINKVTLEEVGHYVVYKMGWQATTLDGKKTVRRLMRFR